jgi:hypothetical protein
MAVGPPPRLISFSMRATTLDEDTQQDDKDSAGDDSDDCNIVHLSILLFF